MVKPLERIDVVISIFNQERIIERILAGVCRNTVTPFNLILVFDGCVDKTKPKALAWLEKNRPSNLLQLITRDAPDVYETKATNMGLKLGTEDYIITIQDDMEIREPGWEVRLTYPIRKYDDMFSTGAYIAHDLDFDAFNPELQRYKRARGRRYFNARRDTLYIRDIAMRSPVAFRSDILRKLDYLNEEFAPCTLDEADVQLRAWEQYGLKSGLYWIDYLSKPSWSKSKSKDSTMNESGSRVRNVARLREYHKEYFEKEESHAEERVIPAGEVDYPAEFDRSALARRVIVFRADFFFRWLAEAIRRFLFRQMQRVRTLFRLAGLLKP
ncbi:MAG: glycosyltransferase family A protein [Patescibacteria group bacterium]